MAKLQRDSSEIAKLLTALEQHVVGGNCPACGHDHGSKEQVLAELRRIRQGSVAVGEAAQALSVATGILAVTDKEISEQRNLAATLTQQINSAKTQVAAATATLRDIEALASKYSIALDKADAGGDLNKLSRDATERLNLRKANATRIAEELGKARGNVAAIKAGMPSDSAMKEIQETVDTRSRRLSQLTEEGVRRGVLIDAAAADVDITIRSIQQQTEQAKGHLAQLQTAQGEAAKRQALEAQAVQAIRAAIEAAEHAAHAPSKVIADWAAACALAGIGTEADSVVLGAIQKQELARATELDQLRERVVALERAFDAAATSAEIATRQNAIKLIENELTTLDTTPAVAWIEYFEEVASVLTEVQRSAITSYTNKFGPIASILQQRLRSVFGFEDIELKAVDGKIQVRVNRNGESLRPIDYFSQSQQLILMLSLFFTACSTQNWSSFAPVLLDDPVTHFDDLNAYAFLDLISGMVETGDKQQFIISTCEERFFKLAKQKLQHLGDRLKIYRFVSLSSAGPVIDSRAGDQLRPRPEVMAGVRPD